MPSPKTPSQQQRAARTRELIQIGGLAEIAGLTTIDRRVLLGGLMYVSELIKDDTAYDNLKTMGGRVLTERARSRGRAS